MIGLRSDVKKIATTYAILAAALYAINIPLSKSLMEHVSPTMMAAFLYLGAGIGLFLYGMWTKTTGKGAEREPLTRKELPYTIAMVVLDIIAPILLMSGLLMTTSANASLLNNFEIVATSLIALILFKEAVSGRLWVAVMMVTVASIMLTFEGEGSFVFNTGSLMILGACICWGLENNCTRMISNKSSVEIVVIKGTFSGLGCLAIALFMGEGFPQWNWILCTLILGFVAYGLSIHLYVKAQRDLGAAKTSAYYSVAPFLGVLFGIVLLGESPDMWFYVALTIMIAATFIMARDTVGLQHTHEHSHTHCHEHIHGDLVHSHEHTHIHSHTHVHGDDEAIHDHDHDGHHGDHDHHHA